jgi:hypothetical protein
MNGVAVAIVLFDSTSDRSARPPSGSSNQSDRLVDGEVDPAAMGTVLLSTPIDG